MTQLLYNQDAEETLVGSILWNHASARQCQQAGVLPKWFGNPKVAAVYAAAMECFEAGNTTHHIVVEDHLRQQGKLEKLGGKELIRYLLEAGDATGYSRANIEIIRRDYIAREQDKLANRIQDAIRLGEDPSPEIASLNETLRDSPTRPRLETITALDLLEKDIPPLEFVVQELLPPGLCFFAGAFKSGKSWAVLQLGLAVARGDAFFGETTSPGSALVVALEDNERRLQERLELLFSQNPRELQGHFLLSTGMPRLDAGGIEELERLKFEFPDMRLIVLDVWQRVRGKERSRNMYADDYHALEAIQSFASDNDVAVVVTHHHRKAGDDDPFNKFSGSTGIGGGSDTLWSLERERGQCEASFITTGRDIQETELALSFDEETCTWTALGPLAEYTQGHERSLILKVLKEEEGRAMSPKEIAEATGKNISTTRNLLKKMLDSGVIDKCGYGAYCYKANESIVDFGVDNDEEL